MIATSLIEELRDIVGRDHVIADADVRASYEVDWTRRFSGSCLCVVRPDSATAVAGVVRACAAAGVRILTQGGNTGLVGGGVPRGGEVVLSTVRLTTLGEVDSAAGQISVGAGVTLRRLQDHVQQSGFDIGVDLAARDTATVGGLAATNAGGIRVLRFGSMRHQIVGIEAVLADGSIISRMAGLTKDSTGYDLISLLVGSEGTLGVITALRLRLVQPLGRRTVVLIAVDNTEAAVALLSRVRPIGTLAAAELFFAAGVDLVCGHTGAPPPFSSRHPAYMLLEVAATNDPGPALLGVVADAPEVLDATVAEDAVSRRALWRYREAHTESISAAGIPVKLDVSVPLGNFAALIAAMPSAVAAVAPDARTILFGHINEGNTHVNVLGADDRIEEVTDAVLRVVAGFDGSISAEHGIGRAKVPWLSLTRSSAEIAAMRAVKHALDPGALFNPGVLFAED